MSYLAQTIIDKIVPQYRCFFFPSDSLIEKNKQTHKLNTITKTEN